MQGNSQLKDSILEQAHEKGQKLLAEAKETVQADASAQEARLVQEKLHQREEQLKRIQRQLQRETQQLENKKRQSTLVTKQRVLKELFADAYAQMANWSAEQELAFIRQVLTSYKGQSLVLTFGAITAAKLTEEQVAQLLADFPMMTLAPDSIAHEAGFVLSVGKVDDTYLYRDLVHSVWEEESYQMATRIFSEDES